MEASGVCMNEQCGAPLPSPHLCKKGWHLPSGQQAALCDTCGTAYGQLVFCDTFHSKDSGWRECKSCGKTSIHETDKDLGASVANGVEIEPTDTGNQVELPVIKRMNFAQIGHDIENNEHLNLFQSNTNDPIKTVGQLKAGENFHSPEEFRSPVLSFIGHPYAGSIQKAIPVEYKEDMLLKDVHKSQVQTNLTMSISPIPGHTYPFRAEVGQEREFGQRSSSCSQVPVAGLLVPKPPKYMVDTGLGANANRFSQIRVARPPVEGRIKNQLLPRYWPRITDEELQQIAGDSNSTVVPLFEKVLSASDAGRIGRLVLPKACAEAYFPPIAQPEGLPLRIHDVKGKEWVFQFRFWPNNNSRMYVLEGVTPCIQSMQLQAGDTVTFSRMDPEGKLLMGFRKANPIILQDKHLPSMPNGIMHSSQSFVLPVTENLHAVNSSAGVIQSFEISHDISLSSLPKQLSVGDLSWNKTETNDSKVVDKCKRTRNIGSKSKRLLVDSEESLKLRISWEELQDLLRPPSSVQPTTVTIEDHEFEEYEHPPVFGKKSIFTDRLSGEQDQWTQCDGCFKWRRIPAYVLLPPKWICQDNTWDLGRSSCSVPEELNGKEIEDILEMSKGFRLGNEYGSSDPNTLINSSTLGACSSEACAASVARTTKHPRHRVGCSCIVCIQPPSGKGKHNPACTCTVCMTVKRRFKTLMMRRKKRQLEAEAENNQRNEIVWATITKGETQAESQQTELALPQDSLGNDQRLESELHIITQFQKPVVESDCGPLDLNCNPDCKEVQRSSSRDSMVSRLQEANLPLNTYLKQNGLKSLVAEQQASSGSHVLQDSTNQDVQQCHEDHQSSHLIKELEVGEKELPDTNQSR